VLLLRLLPLLTLSFALPEPWRVEVPAALQ